MTLICVLALIYFLPRLGFFLRDIITISKLEILELVKGISFEL